MKRLGAMSFTAASVVCTVVVSAAPAFAERTYLNGFFTNRLDSRELNSNAEGYWTYEINEVDCPGDGNLVEVRLVEERLHGDKNYEWQNYLCSSTGGSKVWNATSDGDHHLTWEKADTDETTRNWYVGGYISYPS